MPKKSSPFDELNRTARRVMVPTPEARARALLPGIGKVRALRDVNAPPRGHGRYWKEIVGRSYFTESRGIAHLTLECRHVVQRPVAQQPKVGTMVYCIECQQARARG